MADSEPTRDAASDLVRRGFEEYRKFINPHVALRAELIGEPFRIVRTESGRTVDADGMAIEDFHGVQAFGHRNPAITRACRDFLDSDAANWYPARVNPYAGRLARRLCERTGYSNVFFAGSGTEAVEAALKLARAATGRPRILSLEGAYHGCTFGSCALMAPGVFRDPFAPHLPGVFALPFGDVEALRRALTSGDVAAVVVEPIQLEGGVRKLPIDYVEALCSLTQETGALLVADEIQTGTGRTGQILSSSQWPRRPDAVILGKSLGGGLVPCSAMLTRLDLFERAYGRDFETAEAHNLTFSGHALACVAGLAALDLLTDELLARARDLGASLRADLESAMTGSPIYSEVRGEGLIVGLALRPIDHPWLSFEHFGMSELSGRPTVGVLLCHRLYKRGFHCFVCGHDWSTLRIQPRLNIEAETLREFVKAVREEADHLCDLA